MGNFKLAHFTVRTLGVDEKSFVFPVKAGGDIVKFDGRVVEITPNGGIIGNFHGTVVMGILPLVVFFGLDAGGRRKYFSFST
jgi:hypothetical protein